MRTLALPLALISIVTLSATAAHADDAPPAGGDQPAPPPADPATTETKPAEPATPPTPPPVEAPKPTPVAETPTPPPAAPMMHDSDDLNPNKLLTVGFGATATVLALGALSYEIEANSSLTQANRTEDDTKRASLRKDASHQHKVAGAMAGGAALAIGGAVFMYLRFLDDKQQESSKKISWAPSVSSDGAGFVVGGRF